MNVSHWVYFSVNVDNIWAFSEMSRGGKKKKFPIKHKVGVQKISFESNVKNLEFA